MEAVAGEVGWMNRERRRRSRLARSGGDAPSPSWLNKPEYEEDPEGGDNAYERPVEDRNDFAYYYLDNARGQVMALLARDMQYGINTPGEGGGEDQDKARILEYYKYNAFGSVTVLPVYDRDDSGYSSVNSSGVFDSGIDDIPGSGSRTGWDLVENTPLTLSDNNTLMTNRRNGSGGHAAVGAGYGREGVFENTCCTLSMRNNIEIGALSGEGDGYPVPSTISAEASGIEFQALWKSKFKRRQRTKEEIENAALGGTLKEGSTEYLQHLDKLKARLKARACGCLTYATNWMVSAVEVQLYSVWVSVRRDVDDPTIVLRKCKYEIQKRTVGFSLYCSMPAPSGCDIGISETWNETITAQTEPFDCDSKTDKAPRSEEQKKEGWKGDRSKEGGPTIVGYEKLPEHQRKGRVSESAPPGSLPNDRF